MILLHATRKLFASLPVNEQGFLPSHPKTLWMEKQASLTANPLSGWHGNLVIFQRRQCVLLVHDVTRLCLFLPALKKADLAALNMHFTNVLMNTLLKCGADDHHLEAASQYLRPLKVDPCTDRSVLATLNQVKFEIETTLHYDQLQVADMTGYSLAAWLSDTPRMMKGRRECLWPVRDFLALLEAEPKHNQYVPKVTDNVVSLSEYHRKQPEPGGV